MCIRDRNSADELEPVITRAAEMLLTEGALDVLVADTPPRLKSAWAARSSFLEGIEEQTRLLDECDVVVPVPKIPDYVAVSYTHLDVYKRQVYEGNHAWLPEGLNSSLSAGAVYTERIYFKEAYLCTKTSANRHGP